MGVQLTRPTSAKAWDLRTCWATGQRASVTLDVAECERVEGIVTSVAATDAFVRIAGTHVPLARVLAVHKPSRLGDSSHSEAEPWRGPRHTPPQHEALW